jgi:carbonic anhydrase
MLSPHSFLTLWRHSRSDAAVYAITFVAIVFLDLLEGVQWGVVAALAIAAIRLGRTRMIVRGARTKDTYLFALEGPLTFMSSLDIDHLRREIDVLEPGRAIVLDVSSVTMMDASGAEMLGGVLNHAREKGLPPFVVGLADGQRERFAAAIGEERAREMIATDQRDLATKIGSSSADQRLRAGVARYRFTQKPRYSELFERLAEGQSPHTLFITCSDSRIDPNLITATDPGELFIVRDVGNLVPPGHEVQASAVSAAIDYAVGVLGVRKVVVCGHSRCGAMNALRGGGIPQNLRNLEAWIDRTQVRHLLRSLPAALDVDQVGRLNALAQLDHLRSYPIVAEKEARGELSLGAWFFDVAEGEIEEWSETHQKFVRIAEPHDRDGHDHDDHLHDHTHARARAHVHAHARASSA